jgi:hypothetical protein
VPAQARDIAWILEVEPDSRFHRDLDRELDEADHRAGLPESAAVSDICVDLLVTVAQLGLELTLGLVPNAVRPFRHGCEQHRNRCDHRDEPWQRAEATPDGRYSDHDGDSSPNRKPATNSGQCPFERVAQ